MQPVAHFGKIEEKLAFDALFAPSNPFLDDLPDTERFGRTADKHVEVAGKAILKRRQAVQFFHELIRVGAAFQIDSDL